MAKINREIIVSATDDVVQSVPQTKEMVERSYRFACECGENPEAQQITVVIGLGILTIT